MDMWDEPVETFKKHPVLPHHARTQKGVRFNVQTVDNIGKPISTQAENETKATVNQCAASFYNSRRNGKKTSIPGMKIEQHSVQPDTLVSDPAKSLMQIALKAFAEHYPLSLSPDHIWLVIAYGAARHVEANSEALRDRFVNFQGKKTLTVRKDDAVMGHVPVHEWERDVFREFSKQIKGYIGPNIHEHFAAPFSTTTKTEQAAAEIALMAATAKYFNFELLTACGIPSVELEGTVEDWVELRHRAASLEDVLLPNFAQQWLPHLLPILDEFVKAYNGNVDHEFWQRMVKRCDSRGSGQSAFLSGWINNLYPYLADGGVNRHLKPWKDMTTYSGPEPKEFPEILSSVEVSWDYYKTIYPLHFHAGYVGMTQDPENLALRPHIGWLVSHDPPKEKESRSL